MVGELKLEFSEDTIKKLVLKDLLGMNYYKTSPDDYEAYFYLNSSGTPVFVIETK
jgi:hypothetical protein